MIHSFLALPFASSDPKRSLNEPSAVLATAGNPIPKIAAPIPLALPPPFALSAREVKSTLPATICITSDQKLGLLCVQKFHAQNPTPPVRGTFFACPHVLLGSN